MSGARDEARDRETARARDTCDLDLTHRPEVKTLRQCKVTSSADPGRRGMERVGGGGGERYM